MYNIINTDSYTIEEKYEYIRTLIDQQLNEEKNKMANLSNISAILMAVLEDLNWVGFYIMNDGELVLGPFQGLPACNRIAVGKGVCGTAVSTKSSQLVPNVEEFPGHIACDSASKSELVIPIIIDDKVLGVLDLDSPSTNRFTEEDQRELEEIISMIASFIV